MIYYEVIQDTSINGGAKINFYSDKKKQNLIGNTSVAGFEAGENYVCLDEPYWRGLTIDLEQRAISLLSRVNTIGFNIFLKYLTDGEAGYSNEESFPIYFNYLGLTLLDNEKALINEILTDNGFKIQL